MSVTTPPGARPPGRRGRSQLEGLLVLGVIVAIMWALEAINALASNQLSVSDGIYARNVDHVWAIFTAPFLHFSWQHLVANTIPFAFMGLIIALQGARRLLLVTLIVIVVAGLGTWLIAPSGTDTAGASGVVFGYATYLFARGFFNRSALELLTGLVVGVVWGGALLSSIVPHYGVSWQAHACGAIGGVVAAYLLRRDRPRQMGPGAMSPLDRALAS
ncbi:MAG: rhomboid family intramembrane serine protease [Solirubrobacterales bacterium]|nr:rhomboid family intramembrane serine protease [Solirubrobacterales bacterium]MBV9363960.1 rhomboid family intramembrane serine protease [Solirubrobacterales bacterium]MBV9684221.1 rhomboid family intramembrane serine protease [Solirubrobacterales bacterium]MBV9808072.1 rhomboid family intramembrane serine protease [Solirubrobacterales bacterium]